jgi:ribose transport system substrate-binding protein
MRHMLTRWLLAGVLAGSALLTTMAPSRAAHAASAPTIAFVNINFEAIYFQQLNAGARQMANKLHAHLVIYNANNNPQAQNSAIEAYVAQHVAAIIVDAIDVHGILPAVKVAAAHHIPVVAVDAETAGPGVKTWVGVGNGQGGSTLGRYVNNYVRQHMHGRANAGIVGALNSFIQIERQNGFERALKQVPGIKVVQVVDGKNQQEVALTAAEDLLTGNPTMNVIYATGEPALIGAVAAVKARHETGKIKLFGWDLSPQSVGGIRQGWVIAVVQQNPYGEGQQAVAQAMKLIQGQKVPAQVLLPLDIVTKANVDKFVSKIY